MVDEGQAIPALEVKLVEEIEDEGSHTEKVNNLVESSDEDYQVRKMRDDLTEGFLFKQQIASAFQGKWYLENKNRYAGKLSQQTVPILEHIKSVISHFPKILGRVPKNTPHYLLSRLDNEKLSPLNHAFVQQVEGINKHLFIEIVESAIDVESGDRLDVIFGLDELFEDIDINGDGQMEWSEFTQYIIDAVDGKADYQPGMI